VRDGVEEIDGGWRIPLEGFVAEAMHGLGNTHLRLAREGVEAFISVPVDMAPAIEMLASARAVVVEATVDRDSRLTVDFGEGQILSVPPDPDFENWEVRGPGDIQVVGMPGGGEPAIWDATSKTYRVVDGEVVETTEGDDT